VNRVVLLDTGIIGLITNPKRAHESLACNCWLQTLIKAGIRVILPEIADYEVRRELLRANKIKGIKRLDELANLIEYLPITTDAMRKAALFWAQARQQGQPTAGDKTIDGDMILIAQAVTLSVTNLIIATTNVGHLSKFVRADLWQNISFD
jgi:predicted nucleic acid-binding protein